MATIDQISSLIPTIVVPPSGMTLDGFNAWLYSQDFPERGRITFVDGRLIIEMSPERIDSHIRVKGEIGSVIARLVKQERLGEYYADGARFRNAAAGLSAEPDAAFASWDTLKSGKLEPPKDRPQDGKHIELVGAPDWVCEVLSDSSVDKDTNVLFRAYHKSGVREYWLIDARGKEIKFRLFVWAESGYQAVEPRDDWHVSAVFNREFQLIRYHNEAGNWEYELLSRPHDQAASMV